MYHIYNEIEKSWKKRVEKIFIRRININSNQTAAILFILMGNNDEFAK